MELGYGKVSKTENDLDNLRDFNNHNSNSKMNIKDLENKFTQDK